MGVSDKLIGRKGNAIQDQLKAFDLTLDVHDPIYDSETDGNYYFESYRPSQQRYDNRHALQQTESTYIRYRSMTEKTESIPYPEFLQTIIEEVLPEGFISEDSGEVCETLKILNCPQYVDVFVARAIRSSLDQPIDKQKWVSELITILYDSNIVSRAAANRGFEKLIQQAEDIKLDVPNTHQRILNFVRCATDDGVLDPMFTLRIPEVFLQNLIPSENASEESTLHGQELAELKRHLQSLRTFKSAVERIIVNDFMVSGSQEDLNHLLVDLGHPEFKHELVRRLLKVSMGLSDLERELVSSTLSDRFGSGDLEVTPDDILIGFIRVLGEIEDIKIDIPEAAMMLAKFIVRAVVDEILPPVFVLDSIRLGIGGNEGRNISKIVKMWVFQERKGVLHVGKFRKIWTATDTDLPETRHFKQKARDIILQHFDDHDIDLTYTQLDELEMSPDQAIVFVRKVLELSMERKATERQDALKLIQSLLLKGDLQPQTVRQGFDQSWKCLPNLIVDIPGAHDLLNKLISDGKRFHILPDDYTAPD